MNNINVIAHQLAEAFKNSNEYVNLKNAKKVIDSNQNLTKKVRDFKQKEQEIVNSGALRKDIDIKIAELNKAFNELSKIPEINNYLKLEKQLATTMENVFKSINQCINIDLN